MILSAIKDKIFISYSLFRTIPIENNGITEKSDVHEYNIIDSIKIKKSMLPDDSKPLYLGCYEDYTQNSTSPQLQYFIRLYLPDTNKLKDQMIEIFITDKNIADKLFELLNTKDIDNISIKDYPELFL